MVGRTGADDLRGAYRDLLIQYGLEPVMAQHDPPTTNPWWLIQHGSYRGARREPEGQVIDRMAAVRMLQFKAVFDRLGHTQALLEAKHDQITRIAHDAGYDLPATSFIGVFPLGDLNAHIRHLDGGALVMVHAGLPSLVFQALRLTVSTGRVGPTWAFWRRSLLTPSAGTRKLAELVNAHMHLNAPWLAAQLPALPTRQREALDPMLGLAELFVIAHEFGHLVAGHLSGSLNTAQLTTPVGELEVLSLAWEREYEADRIGADLLLSGLRPSSGAEESYLFAAINFFFLLDALVRAAAVAISGEEPTFVTHPPPGDRMARLNEYLAARQQFENSLWRAQALQRWLFGRLQEVVRLLVLANERFRELGDEPGPVMSLLNGYARRQMVGDRTFEAAEAMPVAVPVLAQIERSRLVTD